MQSFFVILGLNDENSKNLTLNYLILIFQEKISIFKTIVHVMEKNFLFYIYYFTDTFPLVIWCKIIIERNEYTIIEVEVSRCKVRSSGSLYDSLP